MTNDNYEQFYNEVISALRTTLIQSSGDTGTRPSTIRGDIPSFHSPNKQPSGPPWDGFHFVELTRLGDHVFIAFRWRETGGDVFVYVTDMRDHIDRAHPAEFASTVISINLLERLGTGWYLHAPLSRIRGLTFIE